MCVCIWCVCVITIHLIIKVKYYGLTITFDFVLSSSVYGKPVNILNCQRKTKSCFYLPTV